MTRFKDIGRKQELASKPRESEAPLPMRGGRESIPEGVTSLGAIFRELETLTPDFNIQILGVLEKLAMYNPEVSNAVNNIVQLANTVQPFPKVWFDDEVSSEVQKEALTRLKRKSKNWYAFSGGLMSLTSDLLTQAAISGCISAECVPEDDLSGVKKIVLVSPKNIRFKYDSITDVYKHYQEAGLFGNNIEGLIELNNITYAYIAVQRMGEKPYAIPPFLAALDNVYVGMEMAKDVKNVVKKLGAAGFLEVLLTPPKPAPSEISNPIEYQRRTRKHLEDTVPEVEKGVAKGFVTGYKGEHEFKMHNTASNLQGAGVLLTSNDYKIMRGLKQDPMMFGENISTTETLARVILAKMTTQMKTYQHIVGVFLEKVFLMELQLAGYPIKHLEVELDPPLVSDRLKDAQAEASELGNLKTLYDQGIIDQETYASSAGFEKPAEPEPRQIANPFGFTPPLDDEDEEEDGTAKTDPSKGDDKADTKDTDSNKKANKVVTAMRAELGSGLVIADLYTKGGGAISDAVIVDGECISHSIDFSTILKWESSPLTMEDLMLEQANNLGASRREYQYEDDCSCSDHSFTSFAKTDPELEAFLNEYMASTRVTYDKATKKVLSKIAKSLAIYKTTANAVELIDTILYTLYKEWGSAFSEPQKLVISRHLKSAYAQFRKDNRIFGGATGIPKATFDILDRRVIDYYKKSDSFYLGKFVTDEDLKKKIANYIKNDFVKDRVSIDLNADDLDLLNRNLGSIFTGQEWKMKRIIVTTLNKMRNTAAVNYMKQAEVTSFEVVGVTDRLQCAYCANLQGKVFNVEGMMKNVSEYASSDPNYVGVDAPFITSVFKDANDMKNLSGEELQAFGIHAPPSHSNCRCQVVAIID